MQEGNNSETFLGLTKFQFTLSALMLCVVCVAVSVGALAYAVTANGERVKDGARRDAKIEETALVAKQTADELSALVDANTTAFCAQRNALQGQIEQTSNFLAQHPESLFFNGTVTREQLFDSLKRQREQRDALVGIDCTSVDK